MANRDVHNLEADDRSIRCVHPDGSIYSMCAHIPQGVAPERYFRILEAFVRNHNRSNSAEEKI